MQNLKPTVPQATIGPARDRAFCFMHFPPQPLVTSLLKAKNFATENLRFHCLPDVCNIHLFYFPDVLISLLCKQKLFVYQQSVTCVFKLFSSPRQIQPGRQYSAHIKVSSHSNSKFGWPSLPLRLPIWLSCSSPLLWLRAACNKGHMNRAVLQNRVSVGRPLLLMTG